MNQYSQSWVTAVHTSGRKLVLAATGGGSRAISHLLEVPGGSRSVLEAVVPYNAEALVDWLGGRPDKFCSAATSRAMAMAAWRRAHHLAPQADPHLLVGIGATASLASDRPKRGEHRVHVTAQTTRETRTLSVQLEKGARNRLAEEQLAARLVLALVGEVCGVDPAAVALLSGDLGSAEQIGEQRQLAELSWTRLLLGEIKSACWPSGQAPPPPLTALLCGSFNPPHAGHRQMAAIGAELLQCQVGWELSVTNVDKPPLDFWEVGQRLGAISAGESDPHVVLTAAPTFAEKAALFPGCTFLVGTDTLERIADPRYCGQDLLRRDASIAQMAALRCHFLVFGRQQAGKFVSLSDLELPTGLRTLCTEVPAERFRIDLSSTELRAAQDC